MRPQAMPRWTEAEIAILKEHCGISSYQTIRNLLPGRTDRSIENQARNLGLPIPKGDVKPHWSEDEIAILKEHYGLSSYKLIRDLLPGRSGKAINLQARVMGLVADRSLSSSIGRTGYRKHTFKADYFSKPNPENCYWAGFIAADGFVTRDPTPRIVITLSHTDYDHLSLFASHMAFTGTISNKSAKYQNGTRDISSLSIAVTEQMIDELQNTFSITTRKSLTLQPPLIDRIEHVAPFIVGYIDGDGGFRVDQRDGVVQLGIRGTESVLLWIKAWFDRLVPADRPANVSLSDGYAKYQLGGKRLRTIADILLSYSPIHLARKWDKLYQ